MQHILIVETHIKSLISYSFCKLHGDSQEEYLDINNYIVNSKVTLLLEKLDTLTKNCNHYNYLKYQQLKHNNIPLWALMKSLTLGIVSNMYSLLPYQIQSTVSKEFQDVHEKMLRVSLDLLSRVRNVCAHNERLYDYRYHRRQIDDTNAHVKLAITKKNNQYTKGKNDLLAVVIVLKYLLDKDDFSSFFAELQLIIQNLHTDTRQIEKAQLQKYMGFPANWEEIVKVLNKGKPCV